MANRQRAIEMRRQGRSLVEIAEALSLSRERVCQYLRPLGLARLPTVAERFSDEIKRLNGTVPQSEIAATLGIRPETVREVIGKPEPGEAGYLRACEYVGKVYPGSRLFVLSMERHVGAKRQRRCQVRCELCGNEKRVILNNLIHGLTRSCGCAKNDKAYGNHKRGLTMTLDDCQRLRAKLVEKHKADLQALDRVEEMLLLEGDDDVPRKPDGTVVQRKPTNDRLPRKAFFETLATFDGEFTISDFLEKLKGVGIDTNRVNVFNRITTCLAKGDVELVEKRDTGNGPPTNIYRRKIDAAKPEEAA